MASSVFVSTTIPYVNGRPHLGHAFEFCQADAIARHYRAVGADVFLLSGSDENSLKNVIAAEKEGISAQQLVDRNVVVFKDLADLLQMDLSRFIRTSVDQDHIRGSIDIWNRLVDNEDVYLKEYEGLYCIGCEQFFSEDELKDGLCMEHLAEPELISESNYFFRLSRYEQPLIEAIESGRLRITPAGKRSEVLAFLRSGLEDISISRSMERARGWGIRVPNDPTQVMYVWIDALTNYVNALSWFVDDPLFKRYWTDAERRIHVVGKGVIRFHAVYWPAMLMAAGLPLPSDIDVHGYITSAGVRLSKSLGNVVDPVDLIDRFGSDAVRYFMLADLSPFADGDYTDERLVARYNTDLANGLGNLVNRTVKMILSYRSGVVPEATEAAGVPERALIRQLEESDQAANKAMEGFDHRAALAAVWNSERTLNAYINERSPWHLAKSDETDAPAILDTALFHMAGSVRQLARMLKPFLPQSAEEISRRTGIELDAVPALQSWSSNLAGSLVKDGPVIFPRIDHTE